MGSNLRVRRCCAALPRSGGSAARSAERNGRWVGETCSAQPRHGAKGRMLTLYLLQALRRPHASVAKWQSSHGAACGTPIWREVGYTRTPAHGSNGPGTGRCDSGARSAAEQHARVPTHTLGCAGPCGFCVQLVGADSRSRAGPLDPTLCTPPTMTCALLTCGIGQLAATHRPRCTLERSRTKLSGASARCGLHTAARQKQYCAS